MDFYDELAGQYNDIVDEAQRISAVENFAEWLIRMQKVRKVLDVACGTGLHAVALAKLGAEVTAADISLEMLKQAKSNAGAISKKIEWLSSAMENIANVADGPFDAILCLGNSLPHLLTDRQLHSAIRNWKKLLAPGGVVVIQILNYTRILKQQERIVGVTRIGNVEYVRFYDFLDETIRFNVLRLEWKKDRCNHRMYQTALRPYRSEELNKVFATAGFRNTTLFSDFHWNEYDPENAETVVFLAKTK